MLGLAPLLHFSDPVLLDAPVLLLEIELVVVVGRAEPLRDLVGDGSAVGEVVDGGVRLERLLVDRQVLRSGVWQRGSKVQLVVRRKRGFSLMVRELEVRDHVRGRRLLVEVRHLGGRRAVVVRVLLLIVCGAGLVGAGELVDVL